MSAPVELKLLVPFVVPVEMVSTFPELTVALKLEMIWRPWTANELTSSKVDGVVEADEPITKKYKS